jgi:hypothetical protein
LKCFAFFPSFFLFKFTRYGDGTVSFLFQAQLGQIRKPLIEDKLLPALHAGVCDLWSSKFVSMIFLHGPDNTVGAGACQLLLPAEPLHCLVGNPLHQRCFASVCLGMGNGQLWLHSHQCLWSFESGESHQTKAICRGWVQYGGLCPNPPLVSTHICFPSSCFFYKSKGRYF